jgi:hypothetical protein
MTENRVDTYLKQFPYIGNDRKTQMIKLTEFLSDIIDINESRFNCIISCANGRNATGTGLLLLNNDDEIVSSFISNLTSTYTDVYSIICSCYSDDEIKILYNSVKKKYPNILI